MEIKVFKPTADNVLVRMDKVPTMVGSVMIALRDDESPYIKDRGIVLGVGDDVPDTIAVGDHVVIEGGMGRRFVDGGEQYALIPCFDVLAVLEGE